MTARRSIEEMRPFGDGSWSPINLGCIQDVSGLGLGQIPSDRIFVRSDGAGLFYPARSHTLYGPSESAKSWVALLAIRDVLLSESEGTALFLDFEDTGAGEIAYRLMLLGVPEAELKRVEYMNPIDQPDSEDWGDVLSNLGRGDRLRIAVVDAVGGALAEMRRSGMSTDDFTTWSKVVVAPIIEFTGAGVILVDHSPQTEKPGRGVGPIGSQAKRATLTGAGYRVKPVQALRPGGIGVVELYVDKDRPGQVRAVSGPLLANGTQLAARITLDATQEDRVIGTIDPPPVRSAVAQDGAPVAVGVDLASTPEIMERISRAAEQATRPLTQNDLVKAGGGDRRIAAGIVKRMAAAGYLAVKPGGRNSLLHTSARPFRAEESS